MDDNAEWHRIWSRFPAAYRDLIEATELQAQTIFDGFQADRNQLIAMASDMGVSWSDLDVAPGNHALAASTHHDVESRIQAGGHLFRMTAALNWNVLQPDLDAFDAELGTIWRWAHRKFQHDTEIPSDYRREWRVWALRERAASRLKTEKMGGKSSPDLDRTDPSRQKSSPTDSSGVGEGNLEGVTKESPGENRRSELDPMESIAGAPIAGRLSAPAATMPGEPLFENLPEADPRHNALVPFFETMKVFNKLAAEYPDLRINWKACSGEWRLWPLPFRSAGEVAGVPSAPGSHLHVERSAGEACDRLLNSHVTSVGEWFNAGRDPWLNIDDAKSWQIWFYAIRGFWLNAGEDAEDSDANLAGFEQAATEWGYLHASGAMAIGERLWRKMVRSKKSQRKLMKELGLSTGDEIGEYEQPAGWVQDGVIQNVFKACTYFCGVLAAQRARALEKVCSDGLETIAPESEAPDTEAVYLPDDDQMRRSKIRSEWLNQKLIENTWTADTEIRPNGGPTYNTIQRYRSGKRSTRSPYVRLALSKAFRCKFSDVPE